MIRKNLFSRQKAKPIFQRASTSHQSFRFHPQKDDFIYRFNELEEKIVSKTQMKNVNRNTQTNYGLNNFIGESNFVYPGMEKINPKYNDTHLKFK